MSKLMLITEVNRVQAKSVILEQQQAVCDKYASAFCPIEATDMVAFALQSQGKSPIYGVRVHKAKPSDNAEWFIYCGEYSDAEDFYKPMHADHLGECLPMVQKYLALAVGYRFIIDTDGYEDVWLE